MLPDLERLIRLQDLHNVAEDARQRIDAIPSRLETFQTRLAERRQVVDTARQRLGADQDARRVIEKDLAAVQSRLSKFKDQLMAVKTNKEYQAMQKEIAGAEHEIQSFEGRILESLLEADALAADVARQEQELAAEESAVADEQRSIEQERGRLEADLQRTSDAHQVLVGEISTDALALFEHVSKQRKGIAVVEARGGLCSHCHVRLRPQVFNDVRPNDSLIQCESCHRILHFNELPDAESSKPA